MTAAPPPTLCLVTDRRRLCAALGLDLEAGAALIVAQAAAAGAAGITLFQIREPDLPGASLFALARQVCAVAGPSMRVVVNDRADVAVLVGAGVHLRGASIPAARLRRWLPASTWLSAAAHGPGDVRDQVGIDLFVAGTVRPSRSKPATTPLLGFDGLADVVRAAAVPVIGIGGLSADDWPAVRATGAAGMAAVDFFLPRAGESPGQGVQRAAVAWMAATARVD